MRGRSRRVAAGIGILSLAGVCGWVTSPTAAAGSAQPSIVVIVTDDQTSASLWAMPTVRRALAGRGTTFTNFVVSNPLCCPSRAAILTGRYAHTTGVWSNAPPDGGWSRFAETGSEDATIAVTLDDAGYRTALLGKYLNGYAAAGDYVPPGWDRWFAFRTPGYYDYEIVDRERPEGEIRVRAYGSRPSAYSTDILADEAARTIATTGVRRPLFMVVATKAPHTPVVAARRHEGAYRTAEIPLSPSVNEARVGDKPPYIQARDRLTDEEVDRLVRLERDRDEALLAVDELVDDVIGALRRSGRLENSLIVFTSDNGYLAGEHRYRGKGVPYEESVTVPMIARWGSGGDGRVVSRLAANIDLAPTFADLAGVPYQADGVSLVPLLTGTSRVRSSVILESPGVIHRPEPVPPFCGIRTGRYTFVRYGDGFEELYDLDRDPYQLENLVDRVPDLADALRDRTRAGCDPPPPGFAWQ